MNCYYCDNPATVKFCGIDMCAECATKLFEYPSEEPPCIICGGNLYCYRIGKPYCKTCDAAATRHAIDFLTRGRGDSGI